MTTIDPQKIDERWQIVSQSIREGLFDNENCDKIIAIQKSFNLSEEQAEKLSAIGGYVLLGFIREDDVPKEIQETLSIEKSSADKISEELRSGIFIKYEEELARLVPNQIAPPKEKPVLIRSIQNEPLKDQEVKHGPIIAPLLNPTPPTIPSEATPPRETPKSPTPPPAINPVFIRKEAEIRPISSQDFLGVKAMARDSFESSKPSFVPPTAKLEVGAPPVIKQTPPTVKETGPVRIVHYSENPSPETAQAGAKPAPASFGHITSLREDFRMPNISKDTDERTGVAMPPIPPARPKAPMPTPPSPTMAPPPPPKKESHEGGFIDLSSL